MRASKTFFLFLCVVLLGGYIFLVERNRRSPAEQKAVDRQAFDVSMDRVDRIGIRTPAVEVEMVFEGNRWMLVEPEGARASLPVVNQLLARFRSLGRGEFITPADMRSRSLTLADFGLEVPQMMLTLGVEDEKRVYAVGSPNPLGTALYVKEEASQNVMLVSSDLLEILPPDVSHFRDPELFPITPSEVRELALVSDNGTVRLQREGEDWWIENPVRARADAQDVEDLLNKLGQSRIEGVVNRPGADVTEAFNGTSDPSVIRLWANNQTVPIEVSLGGQIPGLTEQCYARITGQGGLVEVSRGLKVLAATPVATLRDRSVFSAAPESVNRLEIVEDESRILLEKEGTEWVLRSPLKLPASRARVQQVIRQWNDAVVERFMEPEDLPEGREALGRVSFGTQEDLEEVSFTLWDADMQPGRALVRRDRTEELLQLVPDIVKFLPRDPLAFVSREILRIDPEQVVRLSLERNENTMAVVRKDPLSEWTTRAEGKEVDVEALTGFLHFLSGLYAESVLSFQPDRMTDPDARVSLGLGGETPANLTLVLSGNMVWIQGEEVMYVVSDAARKELLRSVPGVLVEHKETSDATEEIP